MKNELLNQALKYAEYGWKIHPCNTDKTPKLNDWPGKASSDPEQIKKWWSKWSDASIGCKCGPDSKIWVLDIDLPDGPESLKKLQTDNSNLPVTLYQQTGSGGYQYFFQWNGKEIRNSSKVIAPGVDIRGNGGYVVIPPSNHPSGNQYQWVKKVKIAPAPNWLSTMAEKKEPKPKIKPHIHGQNSQYGLSALAQEIISLSGCSKGQRNDQLNTSAYSLGQLIAGGELELGHVENSLLGVAVAIGLSQTEAQKTIQSGIKSGMLKPRTAPAGESDNYYFNKQNKHNEQNEQPNEKSASMSSCEQKSASEQPPPPMNIAGHIKEFIINSRGSFTIRDIDNEFGLTSRREKNARSQALYIWLEKKLIIRDKAIAGKYHIIDNDIEFIDYDAPTEEQFNIILPFNIHKHVLISPKSIIVVAGSGNAGKTSFILNTLKLNREQNYKLMYLMSEMGQGEYIRKIKQFGEPIDKWKKVLAASKSSGFDGVIQNNNPNGLTCVDYLEEQKGEYFKIPSSIRDIYDSLADGVAIVAIQKHSKQEVARGGEGTMEKSRLYLTIDFLHARSRSVICACKITKLKNFIGDNLQNNELHFEIHGKNEMKVLMDWTPSHKVDRNKCIIEYQRERKLPDTSNDSIEPIYFFYSDTGKHFRVTEDTIVKWGANFENIDDIYKEVERLAKQHNKKPFVKHFNHLVNILNDIDNKLSG